MLKSIRLFYISPRHHFSFSFDLSLYFSSLKTKPFLFNVLIFFFHLTSAFLSNCALQIFSLSVKKSYPLLINHSIYLFLAPSPSLSLSPSLSYLSIIHSIIYHFHSNFSSLVHLLYTSFAYNLILFSLISLLKLFFQFFLSLSLSFPFFLSSSFSLSFDIFPIFLFLVCIPLSLSLSLSLLSLFLSFTFPFFSSHLSLPPLSLSLSLSLNHSFSSFLFVFSFYASITISSYHTPFHRQHITNLPRSSTLPPTNPTRKSISADRPSPADQPPIRLAFHFQTKQGQNLK
ncbi:unnamed protein product [Acanthosepion pharaonis]|uniref:Uncharacterized protein n=1 Tax=Acanthosepion pharaonis TaxID=158019 RepID=A0A812EE02_ACAPH|nr:unnamed protein product [Sepia pharaonis]